MDIVHAQIYLPIFKQGDDLHRCLIKDMNDIVDAKASLLNYAELLKHTATMLETISNNFQNSDIESLEGVTHFIGISGNKNVLENLQNMGLVEIDEEYSGDNQNDYDPNNHNQNNSDNDNDSNNDNDPNNDNQSDV